jgi:hypothetical protein
VTAGKTTFACKSSEIRIIVLVEPAHGLGWQWVVGGGRSSPPSGAQRKLADVDATGELHRMEDPCGP